VGYACSHFYLSDFCGIKTHSKQAEVVTMKRILYTQLPMAAEIRFLTLGTTVLMGSLCGRKNYSFFDDFFR
jgi:hypothetical protein